MPDGAEATRIEVISDIAQVDAAEWDACAGDDDPFVAHAFLDALERSGSAVGDRGWLPQHLVARNGDGRVVGAAPLYLKSHSYGEYVFDWGWADAYERAGGRYYPKLQCAVPFTPVTGPRLLVNQGLPADAREPELECTVAVRRGADRAVVLVPCERRIGQRHACLGIDDSTREHARPARAVPVDDEHLAAAFVDLERQVVRLQRLLECDEHRSGVRTQRYRPAGQQGVPEEKAVARRCLDVLDHGPDRRFVVHERILLAVRR